MKLILSAELWLVNNKIYLRAYSQTIMGISLARNNPIYVLTHDQFDNLGHTILKTLKDCKIGVPHPDFTQKQPKNEMLTATGLKTEKALMQIGKAVAVTMKEDQLDVDPMFFNGKYLTSSPERHILCSLDPDDITQTVLAAFAHCHP